jgi:hypothetical protein
MYERGRQERLKKERGDLTYYNKFMIRNLLKGSCNGSLFFCPSSIERDAGERPQTDLLLPGYAISTILA